METLQQQETKAFLAMAERLKQLELELTRAYERIRQLESQVYGGSTQ